MKLILASASPRRKELLESCGIKFTIVKSDVNEALPDSISPENAVMTLAERKAAAVLSEYNDVNRIILGADTIVYQNSRIIGKPRDRAEAFSVLRSLSGSRHSVYTGVALLSFYGNTNTILKDIRYEKTDVFFRELTDDEINEYIDNFPPYDKAGAYGIQDGAALFVRHIDGDYNNVIGLPLYLLGEMLKKFKQKSENALQAGDTRLL
ncbi:Septum formation protein Maf [bioreactor metagenome]|uniref:Septum formation protein Maf n=1 Tax=bioreactor metagenome TaxID=1076179 RepID=A0A645AIJ1_9ZZZZ|nr:Maf family protein [Oscillospiraceae bacterium]